MDVNKSLLNKNSGGGETLWAAGSASLEASCLSSWVSLECRLGVAVMQRKGGGRGWGKETVLRGSTNHFFVCVHIYAHG